MSFKSLGNILKKRFSSGIGKQITDAVICDTFDELVDELWQGMFKEHVKAKFVRDGVLTVEVDHSLYAQEVKSRQSDILEALNDKAGMEEYVHGIAFSLMI